MGERKAMTKQSIAAVGVAIAGALDTDERSIRAKQRRLNRILREARMVKHNGRTMSAARVPSTREHGDYSMHLCQSPHIYLSDRQRKQMIAEIVKSLEEIYAAHL